MARFEFPHFEFLARFARNRGALVGACLILLVTLVALLASLMFPVDPLRIVSTPELWPGEDPAFPLGTDSLGRDILAMIVHGARATLLIGLFASAVATLIGVTVGAVAGYFGGWVDEVAMRAAELFQTIPNLIFVLTIVVILGSTLSNIVIAIGIVSWTSIARMTRAEFLALRDREFVQACRAMGMGNTRIIVGEILPNALPPVIVLSSLVVAGAILFESTVSFLGLGVQPPQASWGNMLNDAQNLTLIQTMPWLWVPPGIAIALTVLSVNFVGDGLRDALDPRQAKGAR